MATKIIIAGIESTGGYYGGMLARHNTYSEDVEVVFYMRSWLLRRIQQVGLTVKMDKGGIFLAQAKKVTDNSEKIGTADYLFLADEEYMQEESIEALKPCISKNTVVLLLQNGSDTENNLSRVRTLLPNNEIWQGYSAVEAAISDTGVLTVKGNKRKMRIDISKMNGKYIWFEKILKDAGVNVELKKAVLSREELEEDEAQE